MKRTLLFLILCPLLSAAQNKSRFVNDTLYTSCGYKIYVGQTLKFSKATGFQGFRFVDINNSIAVSSLENNTVVVKKLSNYRYTMFGYPAIYIKGSIVYRDGSKGTIGLELAFDMAIGSRLPGTVSELILSEEFNITKEKAAALYLPAFEADTLYTSCGFKIYKGQMLQFGKFTGKGKFRYVNIKKGVPPKMLEDNQLRISDLKDFGISALGNGYIYIIGAIIYQKRKIDIELHMAFDHAIGHSTTEPGELLVPEEFMKRIKMGPEPDIDTQQDQ